MRNSVVVVGCLAVALSVSAGEPSPWTEGWRLDRYSRIEGNLLIVDVPEGASGGAAHKTVDLTKFPKGVELHVRCRGENITKPEVEWLGAKFMLHYTDGGGTERWRGAPQMSGTFDWCDWRFSDEHVKGLKGGSADLKLGLEAATGRIVFDLSTLRLVECGAQWAVPDEDRGYRCAYTSAVAGAPQMRGVMLPAAKCKEDDFRTLREWGATLVRYQMCRNWTKADDNRDLGEYDRWLDGKLDHLDREVLPWAAKYGLEVVVDLHVVPGGSSKSGMNMFYEKNYGDHFVLCWQRIARRFKGRRNIYGYDLVNEPNQLFSGVPDGDWWSLQRRAAEAVRAIDPDVAIIVESNGLDAPRTFASFRPLRMTNVIYQAHVYQPMAFTHQGVNGTGREPPTKYPDPAKGWDREFLRQQVAEVRKFQQEHGARIYIGEFSAITWAEGADAYLRDCISLFEEYGWDWSYHAFREWSGWDVEKVCTKGARTGSPEFADAPDTPRKRVLLDGFRTLDARAAAESLHVVRELGVDGQPAIWNGHAVQFTYPPQFDFKAVPGAVGYRFTLIDDIHRVITMEAKLPTDPLTPVWTNLTDNGFVSVVAHGLDAAGEVCGLAGTRRFWKLPRFHPGKYPKARRGYLEAARLAYDYIFNLPSTQYFLKNGKPDPGYGLNAYPAKMHSALVSAMVRYAKLRPDRSADALRMARIAADYLLSISVPAGKPLAHFPPTYDNPKVGPGLGGVGPASQGKNMLLYPAQVGAAYLDLYGALGETKYLAAAEAIAETYLRIQDKDGTCYLKVDQATGKPVNENRAFPLGICEFLERLQAVTGKKPYLEAAERGIGYVLSGPVKDWNWEGQFEDVEPSGKYVNLTKHPPCETALYLLKHRGKEEWVRRFAREVLRFSEDQFICWERPCRQDGTGPCSDRRSARDYLAWDCPGVLEQYKCYIPIDASISKVLITYAASWRETGDVLDLAKARALADALVNSQAESGRIPTFWTEWGRREPKSDWLNCMAFSAMTLEDFASVIGEGNPKSLK